MPADQVFAPVNQTAGLFITPVAGPVHLKEPTATGLFAVAGSRWMTIVGSAKDSTTEQDVGFQHDEPKPGTEDSTDVVDVST